MTISVSPPRHRFTVSVISQAVWAHIIVSTIVTEMFMMSLPSEVLM
ncbi:MAG: hypothetical protein ACOH2E_08010 [Candidatus Paracaedibacter sp.]